MTGKVVDEIASHMDAGDIIIDGGNRYYRDDIVRAMALEKHYAAHNTGRPRQSSAHSTRYCA